MKNPEHVLRTRMEVERPLAEVFSFFAKAGNLEAITPPELRFRLVTPGPITITRNSMIDYRLSLFGIPFTWRTHITHWDPPYEFEDTQITGPYAQWVHRHLFREENGATVIEDEVRYRLPVLLLGEIAWPVVRLQLARIFRHRQRRIHTLLA
jgi:ligand-binding SRPBCC domain-containing protein